MDAVHTEDYIEGLIRELEGPDVSLNGLDIPNPHFFKPFPGLNEHILAIVKASDLRLFHPGIFPCRENAGPDWYIKKLSGEIIREIGKRLRRYLIVVDPIPEYIHIQAAPPLGAGQDIIINISGLSVGLLNLVTHDLCLIKTRAKLVLPHCNRIANMVSYAAAMSAEGNNRLVLQGRIGLTESAQDHRRFTPPDGATDEHVVVLLYVPDLSLEYPSLSGLLSQI